MRTRLSFAAALYWLSAKNGVLWPACTHRRAAPRNKSHRDRTRVLLLLLRCRRCGTSAMPKKDSGLTNDQRVITIGKSRLEPQW